MNGTSNVRRAGLGEDQLYAGIDHLRGRWAKVDLGYLMIDLDRRGPDQFNDALMVGFSIKTPAIGGWF